MTHVLPFCFYGSLSMEGREFILVTEKKHWFLQFMTYTQLLSYDRSEYMYIPVQIQKNWIKKNYQRVPYFAKASSNNYSRKKNYFFCCVSVAFFLSITLSLRKFFAQFKIAFLFSMVVKFFISSDNANTCISYEMTRLINHDSAHKHWRE